MAPAAQVLGSPPTAFEQSAHLGGGAAYFVGLPVGIPPPSE